MYFLTANAHKWAAPIWMCFDSLWSLHASFVGGSFAWETMLFTCCISQISSLSSWPLPRCKPILFLWLLPTPHPGPFASEHLKTRMRHMLWKYWESHSFPEECASTQPWLWKDPWLLRQGNHPGVPGPQSQHCPAPLSSSPASEEQTCRSTNWWSPKSSVCPHESINLRLEYLAVTL